MSDYVISYDVGTTGIKTCLFKIDETITLVKSSMKDYELMVLANGGIEQNPDDWYDAMVETTKKVMNQSGVLQDDIKGISFCAQMQGVVLVDIKGNKVRPAMSYMDNRASEEQQIGLMYGPKISGMNAFKLLKSLKITGAVPASIKDPVWKYKWVEKNEPDIFQSVYKWLDIKEYLIMKLTGEFVMTEDSAFATLLYDMKKKEFSKEMCNLYGVQYEHMPRVIKCTDRVGTLLKENALKMGLSKSTPVFGGGGDASLVGIGAGAVDVGDTHIYVGTSGWVSTVVDKKMIDIQSMIASIQGASSTSYNYFAELETAGKCLEWVKDHMALDEIGLYIKNEHTNESKESLDVSLYDFMMDTIKDIPPGSNGVIFTPWLHGNRCPFEDHYARGIFFNIGLETGKRDMIHAVLEGVCYHLRWQLEAVEKKAKTNDVIRFVGGGALSDKTSQILSNILGRKIETVEQPQNIGSVGAALITGVGLKLIDNLSDVKKMITVSNTFLPQKETIELYNSNFNVFKSLYSNNKKSFLKLNKGH